LNSATENVVAQATWVFDKLGMGGVSEESLKTPRSYEARFLNYFQDQQWAVAEREACNWLVDEPYSSRPALSASFMGLTVTNNFDLAAKCIEIGLRADPNESMLLNNLAVARAYQGRVDDAVKAFTKIKLSGLDKSKYYIYAATAGLLEFRLGNPEKGREYYKHAERLAPQDCKLRLLAFRAREEALHDTEASNLILERIGKLSKTNPDSVTKSMADDLRIKLVTKNSPSIEPGNKTINKNKLIPERDAVKLILPSSIENLEDR
jgi:tetratricopeptide (TPR) repeat protein